MSRFMKWYYKAGTAMGLVGLFVIAGFFYHG
jgi:hypothetical protein